jgi:ribosomal protein S18 acetylase RimI-like enzyme
MKASINLRSPQDGDDRPLADLYLAARQDALSFLPKVHTDDEVRAWMSYVVLATLDVQIAEIGGHLAGFIAMNGGEIEQLYVHPAFYRQGAGCALINWAMKITVSDLSLHCFAANQRARRFYESFGFKAVKFGDGSGNEEGAPDVRYVFYRT